MANKVTIDAINRIIQVNPGITEIDVKIDLYSDLKEDWLTESDLGKFEFPFISIAGNSIGLGQVAPAYFFLKYPWLVQTNGDGNLIKFALNLYGQNEAGDDIRDVFDIIPGDSVQNEISNIPGFDVLTQQAVQYSSFDNRVTVDIINGVAGTEYPIGNMGNPGNNIPDAVTIAGFRGINIISVIGNIILDTGDVLDELTIIGQDQIHSLIDVRDGADVQGSIFENCTLTGILDGNNFVKNCRITDLSYLNGYIIGCALQPGTITLGGGVDAHFDSCWTEINGSAPVIDCGGTGQSLNLSGYRGPIKVINQTDSNEKVFIVIDGTVEFDSTITAGDVTIVGVGTYANNMPDTVNFNSDGFVSNPEAAKAVWAAVVDDNDTMNTFGWAVKSTLVDVGVIRQVETGRWKIENDTMIFYDDDGVTPILTFDLKDQAGAPSMENVFERILVP